jgi:hypothetical protein
MPDKVFLVVKPAANDKILYQRLTLSDAFVVKQWGFVGGAESESDHGHGFTNEGKSNQLTPNETAEASWKRDCKKLLLNGCWEVPDLEPESMPDFTAVPPVDLDNIPTALTLSKPTQSIGIRTLNTLHKSGFAKYFIKYNGLNHYVVIDANGKAKLFTRKWFERTTKYPEIVKEIEGMGLPRSSMLVVELVIDPILRMPHMNAFLRMCKIDKTDTKNGICTDDQSDSIMLQQTTKVKAAVYGILFTEGKPVWESIYDVQLKTLQTAIPKITENKLLFVPSEVPISSAKAALDIVRIHRHKIEGLIVWDTREAMKMTMDGKPARCACWKLKFKSECDIIAWGWQEGRGKNQGRIGSLKIGQYGSDGEMIDLGTVGGLKDDQKEPNEWDFPCVIEVKYDQRFPDTGCFQFGSFVKPHESKTVDEVDTLTLPMILKD